MTQEGKPGQVVLVNKPVGWTSFQAVKKVKWLLRAKKAGHAGTLDPLASGLLIICTEKQTKTIQSIQDAEKEYTGTIILGATTPSFDLETEVNATYPTSHIDANLVETVLKNFRGEIQQAPPLYSAIKVDGQRAYNMARGGVEHEMKKRPVLIKEFEVLSLQLPELKFRVVCSKGTYIRSLAHDLGLALGSGGYLTELVRTRIGEYRLENAKTPAEMEHEIKLGNASLENNVLPANDIAKTE